MLLLRSRLPHASCPPRFIQFTATPSSLGAVNLCRLHQPPWPLYEFSCISPNAIGTCTESQSLPPWLWLMHAAFPSPVALEMALFVAVASLASYHQLLPSWWLSTRPQPRRSGSLRVNGTLSAGNLIRLTYLSPISPKLSILLAN